MNAEGVSFTPTLFRPAVHSDFIWIILIFFLKFSEIQINWLKMQIFWALNLVEISNKSAILVVKSDSSLYFQIFSHIHSDIVSDRSGMSELY